MDESLPSLTLTAQQVIDNMLEGVLITNPAGTIITINPAFTAVTGYSPQETIGKTPALLRSGRHKPSFYKRLWTTIAETGHWEGEITNRKKNGDIYTEWLTISVVRGPAGEVLHYMGVFNDITKEKRAQERIKHLAYFDALTDLPNRALFREHLNHALASAERQNERLGVLFLDLDRVKVINDTLGHDVGDQLLIGVAQRLRECLRSSDTVARLGGDEFMLLIQHVENFNQLSALCVKILDSLKPAFYIEGHEIFTTASIGISIYPYDGRDAETLLKNADTAMYRAKRLGRNTFQAFNSSMKAEVQQQLALGNGLRRAIDRNEIVVHYQPQINIVTGEIIGMEALVRWQHPELGMVYPTQFIHWAEDSGLIVPLGEMVMRIACAQNKAWQDAGLTPLRVAVNLSAAQFRHTDMLATVRRILNETGLPPAYLQFELTESVMLELAGAPMRTLNELKALGVDFSIDDFGTGYSSLSYLKRFPASELKMDQMFVRDLNTNPSDAAIATAVVALGHSLGLTIVAEGVETAEQLECLRHLHCDRMQGYLVSPPLPPDKFEKFLTDQTSSFPTLLR